jgi:MFS family permease
LRASNVLHRPHAGGATVVTGVILLYVLYNVTYAVGSLPLGGLSDRIGQVPLVLGGYLVFAAVYAGFAAAGSTAPLVALFAVYGLYIAATDGTSKALISRAVPAERRGSALGLFAMAGGVATLVASSVGGVLWSTVGPWATFVYGSVCALGAAAVLVVVRPRLELR